MWEGRRTNPRAVAHGATVGGQVIAVNPFGCLDGYAGLAGWDYRPPTHTQEVSDQSFNIMQHAFARWWRGQRMIGLNRPRRHVVHALFDNAQTLAYLVHPHAAAVVAIAVHCRRHFKVEVLIAAVGARLT